MHVPTLAVLVVEGVVSYCSSRVSDLPRASVRLPTWSETHRFRCTAAVDAIANAVRKCLTAVRSCRFSIEFAVVYIVQRGERAVTADEFEGTVLVRIDSVHDGQTLDRGTVWLTTVLKVIHSLELDKHSLPIKVPHFAFVRVSAPIL